MAPCQGPVNPSPTTGSPQQGAPLHRYQHKWPDDPPLWSFCYRTPTVCTDLWVLHDLVRRLWKNSAKPERRVKDTTPSRFVSSDILPINIKIFRFQLRTIIKLRCLWTGYPIPSSLNLGNISYDLGRISRGMILYINSYLSPNWTIQSLFSCSINAAFYRIYSECRECITKSLRGAGKGCHWPRQHRVSRKWRQNETIHSNPAGLLRHWGPSPRNNRY